MKSEEDSSSRGVSVKQYAQHVFQESLVTGVPGIISAPNWKRKIFKMVILGLCIGGFLYQSIEFVSFVLTYPSVVDINVHTPETFLFPAFTMCNNNGFKRSKFCEAFPEKCETPENETEFCSLYPYYCDGLTEWTNFKVPKREFYESEKSATLGDLKALGHEKETFVTIENGNDEIEGPKIFFKNEEAAFACYLLHSRVNSSSDPDILSFSPLAGMSILELAFNFEPNETFLPGREPSGLLAIHSPFELVNPYDFGIAMKPGKIYKIHLQMQEEELLPLPYQNCVNYTQRWLDNGRTGSRSQQMCKHNCIMESVMKSCNCSFKGINYPHGEDTCFSDDISCTTDETIAELALCITDLCKDDCQKYKFLYVMQERNIEEIDVPEPFQREKQKAYVHVYASDPEVIVYKYRPHYQNIEVFSYIGGYIGAWLGISLIAVADFFECLFDVTVFAIGRRGKRINTKAASTAKL